MKRSEMVCVNCIKFAASDDSTVAHQCRNNPQPRYFINKERFNAGFGDLIDADPATHWCGNGEWLDEELTPFVWGEWHSEDK